MQEEPRRRRPRGPRRSRRSDRPTQAPAPPTPPPALRGGGQQRGAPPQRGRARPPRPPRVLDDVRAGTPILILLDAREGEPDRTGASGVFEGYFDFETGEPRRMGSGIPRLKLGPTERLWGFECWWRLDPTRAGLTADDREALEMSKRLLRGLMRDSRRQTRLRPEVPAQARTTSP